MTSNIASRSLEIWGMGQRKLCCLYKREDLSLNLQSTGKSPGMVAEDNNLITTKMEDRRK